MRRAEQGGARSVVLIVTTSAGAVDEADRLRQSVRDEASMMSTDRRAVRTLNGEHGRGAAGSTVGSGHREQEARACAREPEMILPLALDDGARARRAAGEAC